MSGTLPDSYLWPLSHARMASTFTSACKGIRIGPASRKKLIKLNDDLPIKEHAAGHIKKTL
jgi:hypothetical protein